MQTYSLHFQFHFSSCFKNGSYEGICVQTIGLYTAEDSRRGEVNVTFIDKRQNSKIEKVPVSALHPILPLYKSKEGEKVGLVMTGANLGKIVKVKYRKANQFRVSENSGTATWWEGTDNVCRIAKSSTN